MPPPESAVNLFSVSYHAKRESENDEQSPTAQFDPDESQLCLAPARHGHTIKERRQEEISIQYVQHEYNE